MQTVCTSLQTDNHANTLSLNFYHAMLFLMPNQQCQSTEGQSTSIYLNNLVVDIYLLKQFGGGYLTSNV